MLSDNCIEKGKHTNNAASNISSFNLPDSESSDRINIVVRTASKCKFCAHSTRKVFPTIYFCDKAISNKWINKLGRTCHIIMSSVPTDLKREKKIYSLMPQIFASATEHKYNSRFYHSTQQSRTAHKIHQDSRSHHMLSGYRRKHRIYTRKYKLKHREQEAKRKIRKEASDILKVPIRKRKLLCKYRKSCYDTGLIPDTRNIYNILPRFLDFNEPKNLSKKGSMIEMPTGYENEEKEEISEAELKLLCRYRKSCYKEVGAKIEKNGLKVQAGPILSRVTILPVMQQKSTEEIARIAIAKVEEKRIAALRSISRKVIIDRDLNQTEEKKKKRLACKYRKSCYDSGILPEIGMTDNLFLKIYYFLSERNQRTGVQEITHKEFKDLSDNEKIVYCKYRKSCYNTAQKPVINHSQTFKYIHTIKKYEEVIPLEIRCKYRKSCYDTEILPDLKKETAEKMEPVVPVPIVTSLYHLKTLCKYRKSCYKQKAEEQQNLNVRLLDEVGTHQKEESEREREEEEKEKIIELVQKEVVFKPGKTEELSAFKKMQRGFETKTIKEINSKKLIKKSELFVPELEAKKMVATTQDEKFEGIPYEPKKTKDPIEETSVQLTKKNRRTISPTRIVKQPTIEKRAPERTKSKKERLKLEKVQKYEKIRKEKEILIKGKDSEKKLSTATKGSLLIKEVQSIFLQDENITSLQVGKNLSPLTIKLLCKYRKSCYENGELPSLLTEKRKSQDFQEKEDRRLLEIWCKYRKSCYETGKLPENLYENFKTKYLSKKEEKHIPLSLRCKYRKSCYETGKLPSIERSTFEHPTIQITNEYKNKESVGEKLNKEQLKLRCKYRKSCYESGMLPQSLNHTEYVVSISTKQYENPQLKCKYRKSCYESMELNIKLNKIRKKEEQKKNQEGIVKAPYQTEPVARHKEKEQKEEMQEEVTNKEDKPTRKKKSKEPKSEAKEQEYMQIKPLDSELERTTTKSQQLNSAQKLRCKYRLKCYNSMPLQQVVGKKRIEKQRHLSIKNFRRANGAICNIYYISCRKQAGLPILERPPIGPNGRRLCRKKKKEAIIN